MSAGFWASSVLVVALCAAAAVSYHGSHDPAVTALLPSSLLLPPLPPVSWCASVGAAFLLGLLVRRRWWNRATGPSSLEALATARASKRARAKDYPPAYPNGWYKLCDSDDLPAKGVKRVTCLGQHLVLFRTEKGEAKALDAYCPHMGADLGIGGKVVGDCIECPFHKWTFDGEGKCTHIPYSKKPPEVAKARSWHVLEYHKLVCVWYDAEGRDPPYEPPRIKQIDEGKFVYRGKYDAIVKMHIQEFAENSADFQHFEPLHGQMCLPFTLIPIPGMRIVHQADWIPGTGEETHMAYFKDKAQLQFCGRTIPRTGAQGTVSFIGPASICYFHFETEIGDIMLFHTHTPLEPLLQKVEFRYWADKSIPRFLVWYVVGNWIAQWKNDISIWENKVWQLKPVLVKEDGPVQKLRRWYAQFYSNKSAVEKNTLEW